MHWHRVAANWSETKSKIKEKWYKLTDEDLDIINGRRDRLEGRIQARYGFAENHAREDVDNWIRWQHARRRTFTTPLLARRGMKEDHPVGERT
jgi:uncharacterized protein YjbJ (UPF0337 family)